MIRKSMPLGHDPMGGYRFSLGTNAKRLPGDHAPTKSWSGMTIRRKVIPLWRFFWVCAIPNGPGRYRRAAPTGAIRPERRRPPMDQGWPPELKVKSTAAQILGASSAYSRFDKQPLVTKYEISIEALSGLCMAKDYAACAYQKRKMSNTSVSYEPHHKHRSAPFGFSHLPEQSSVAD